MKATWNYFTYGEGADDEAQPRLLAYTMSFYLEGSTLFRAMGKLLVSSLLRTGFCGNIIVFHNNAVPLFPTGGGGVIAHFVYPATICERMSYAGSRFNYEARDWIDGSLYDHILYLDSDCLALRNIDQLLVDWAHEVTYLEEHDPIRYRQVQRHFSDEELAKDAIGGRRGSNAGIWRVRGDLAQWNRLVVNRGYDCTHFPFDEALINTGHVADWTRALIHFPGMNYKDRLSLMFDAYSWRFYGDAAPVLVDLLAMIPSEEPRMHKDYFRLKTR
jgi:hypothetical protein